MLSGLMLRQPDDDIDILPPDTADLSGYKLVLAPGVATLSDAFLSALSAHKGTALIGPRSNAKTTEFATPVPLPPNLPNLSATVARVESLPPDVPACFPKWMQTRMARFPPMSF